MRVNKKVQKRVLFAAFMSFAAFSTLNAENVSANELNTVGESTVQTVSEQKILNKTKFLDNWFVTGQVGGLYNWGSNCDKGSFWHHLRPTAAVSVGKWFSPTVGARVQGFFSSNRAVADNWKAYHWNAMGVNGDGLFNFTNLFLGYKENRFFNLIGFVGIGWEHTTSYSQRDWNNGESLYDRGNTDLLAVHLGAIARFRLSNCLDLDVEVGNSLLDDSYDGQETSNRWDGHVNLMVGLNYRFKNHDGSHQFTYARLDDTKIKEANDEINRLRAQTSEIKSKVDTIRRDTKVAEASSSLVSFANNSSAINELQQLNIYTAATNFKKMGNDGRLYIIPANAQPKDQNLYLQRAQSVRDALVKEYNIPAGRIQIERDSNYSKYISATQARVIVYIVE